jgi:hypothetical protein
MLFDVSIRNRDDSEPEDDPPPPPPQPVKARARISTLALSVCPKHREIALKTSVMVSLRQ